MKIEYKSFRNILPLFFIWILIVIIFSGIFKSGVPPGSDTLGHLAKVQYLGEHFKSTGSIASWMPYWYSGFPILKYYPPLWYIVSIPVYYIFGNAFKTYNFLVIAWGILASSVVYFTIKKRINVFSASFAAFLLVIAPFSIRELFMMGGIPRLFSIIFFPICLYLTQDLFKNNDRRKAILLLSFSFSFYILFHALTAFFSMTTLFVYIILRCILEKKLYIKQIISYIASIGLSVALSAWWLIPAYFGKMTQFSPREAIVICSVSLKEIFGFNFHFLRDFGSRYLGFSIFMLALISVIVFRNREKFAIFLTAIYCIIFSLGVNTPFYDTIFYSNLFFPERALNDGIFLLILLSSMLFLEIKKFKIKKRAIIAFFIIFLCLLDFYPSLQLIKNREEPEDIISTIEKTNSDGRIAFLGILDPAATFYPVLLKRYSVDGFYIQGTLHNKDLTGINFALSNEYYAYILKQYDKWNVSCVAVSGYDEFGKFLEENGFSKRYTVENIDLYCRDARLYIEPLKKTAIAIGKYSQTVSMAFPEVAEGYSDYIDEYSIEYLKNFDTIVFTGFSFHDKQRAEEIVVELAARGITVVVDLQGAATEWYETTPSFLGADSLTLDVEGTVDLVTDDEILATLEFEPFSYEGGPWRSPVYLNLDNELLKIKKENELYTILGYKRINGEEVYFIGLNLFYHTLLTKDAAARALLAEILQLHERTVNGFSSDNFSMGDESVVFEYTAENETWAVVSVTWSQNWKGYIDDQDIEIHNFENLILLQLPEGTHRISIRQERTSSKQFSLIVSLLAILTAVFLFFEPWKSKRFHFL